MSVEQQYVSFEKAKNYTKLYTLEATDEFIVKQEDGYLGYASAGQLATTGSNIFRGGQILVGNLTIDGNIYANTYNVTTTSIEHFTASTNFGLDNGDTHTFTGSVYITGSESLKGDLTVSGSLYVSSSLNINNGFYVDGNKQFNYGVFSDLTIQSASADTAYPMKLNTTDLASGVSIVGGSRITVANTGTYNLQFSAQIDQTTNNAAELSIWIRKGGTNVPNSNTEISIAKNGKLVAAWNFIVQLNATQYVELMWSSTRSDTQLHYHNVLTTPTRPAVPSVIATITQIA